LFFNTKKNQELLDKINDKNKVKVKDKTALYHTIIENKEEIWNYYFKLGKNIL